MDAELKSLRIDRSEKRPAEASPWATRWIAGGVLLFVLLGAGRFAYNRLNAAVEVETARVRPAETFAPGEAGRTVILNATGYIIAAHKIEVAAKVIGKVAWIGVDKGDRVTQGQVMVRLEDEEYRAQVMQAKGQVDSLKAKLAELVHGSRPEEIAKAKADVEQSRADLEDALVTLRRTKDLVSQGVLSKQSLDDAQSKYDGTFARTASLDRTYDLAKLGPRQEQIDAQRAAVEQAQGTLDLAETQLDNTVIRAPTSGTILERNVEKGEFVTTGFVGDKGAKGYVVSLANLNDLQVELDINQNDFAKLAPTQKGVITTDAYPDRKYEGVIEEISPEANRQKATVQVKVQVLHPDSYLRPEMNASVSFYDESKDAGARGPSQALVTVPAAAVRDGTVFVVVDGKAVKRTVTVAAAASDGARVSSGLIGGEDVILNPPADLKDGAKVAPKKS